MFEDDLIFMLKNSRINDTYTVKIISVRLKFDPPVPSFFLKKVDEMVPEFIAEKLGSGLRGLMTVALLSAAMSSIDSALNSLSAAFMKNFVESSAMFQTFLQSPAYACAAQGGASKEVDPNDDNSDPSMDLIPRNAFKENERASHDASRDSIASYESEVGLNGKQQRVVLVIGKGVTLGIGICIVAFGYCVPFVSDTVVDAANLLSSAFYGPILATFTMGCVLSMFKPTCSLSHAI
jgi:hypothetical protein